MAKNNWLLIIGIILAAVLIIKLAPELGLGPQATYTSTNKDWLLSKCAADGAGVLYLEKPSESLYCLYTTKTPLGRYCSGTFVQDCGVSGEDSGSTTGCISGQSITQSCIISECPGTRVGTCKSDGTNYTWTACVMTDKTCGTTPPTEEDEEEPPTIPTSTSTTRGNICLEDGPTPTQSILGITGATYQCSVGELCLTPIPWIPTLICFDIKIDTCQIACSQSGRNLLTPTGGVCTNAACEGFNTPVINNKVVGDGKCIPTGTLVSFASGCLPCLENGAIIPTGRTEKVCCSGDAQGSVCYGGEIPGGNPSSNITVPSNVNVDLNMTNLKIASNTVPSVTISGLKGITSAEIWTHACNLDSDCKDGDCKSLTYLKEQGYISDKDQENFFDKYSPIAAKATGGLSGAGLGIAAGALIGDALTIPLGEACFTAGVLTGGPLGSGICALIVTAPFIISGGVAGYTIGGTVAEGTLTIFDKIANNDPTMGVCISEGGTGDYCSWFDFLKDALPKEHKDKSCLVGTVGAFIILLIILRGFVR